MAKQTRTSNPSSRSRTFLALAGLWTVLALGVHGYLLGEHNNLRYGTGETGALCNIGESFSCSAVSASRYAEFLGVPVALWGFLANLVLLALIVWHPFVEDEKKAASRRNLLLVSGVIALTSVVMGSISMFALSKFCLYCMMAYALSFLTFGFLFAGLRSNTDSKLTSAFSIMDFKPAAILALIAFGAGFIANDQIKKSYGSQNMDQSVQSFVADWQNEKPVQIQTIEPLAMGAPADKAKMTIVEFADFRCIHCKHAAPSLKAFIQAHPDARLEFQAWPLDGECNTAISQANGASCMLARAVNCAEQKGKAGWKAHEYIFAQDMFPTVQAVEAALPAIAEASGVNPQEFMTCTQSDEAKDLVRRQAALGTSLGLKGTPSIYVNGRVLQGGQMLPVLSGAYRQIQ